MTEPNDDKVLRYLTNRGDVTVPKNLSQLTSAIEVGSSPNRRSLRPGRPLVAATTVVLVVVATFVVVNAMAPSVAHRPTGSPPLSPVGSAFPVIGPPFPTSVEDLPVITVADAATLAANGGLDGRDVAIGGYFTEGFASCPYVGNYQGPLWDWCRIASFADSKSAAQTCTPIGSSGVTCSGGVQPGPMVPLFMSDTMGGTNDKLYSIYPIAIVVIAHVADPRWLQCFAGNAEECRKKLVADRLAWVDGNPIEPAAQFARIADDALLTPSLTLAQVTSALGNAEILSAIAITADDARSIDPRWNQTGSRVVWVVRSVADAGATVSDPTRAVTVSLLDDATGQIVEQLPLALPAEYHPARLWVTETRNGVDVNSANSIAGFYRVELHGGDLMRDGVLNGGSGGSDNTVVNGPDLPLILQPGTYDLTAWIGRRPFTGVGAGPSDPPTVQCSTEHTFAAGDDVLLDASFSQDQTCTWSGGAKPSFGFP